MPCGVKHRTITSRASFVAFPGIGVNSPTSTTFPIATASFADTAMPI